MLGRTLTRDNVHKARKFLNVLLGAAFEIVATDEGLRIRKQVGWVDEGKGTRLLHEVMIRFGKKIRDIRKEGYSD